ncbi:hypothetical protein BH11PSE11_BH11PSE11_20040 [soil metagenome]
MRSHLVNESIATRLRQCKTLPTLPAVAIRIIELANDPDVSLEQLSGLVGLDPALSAKLVKAANSALYQSHRTSTNVRQAIEMLGTHASMLIVLSFSLAASFKNCPGSGKHDRMAFWRRSVLSALACRAIGEKFGVAGLDDLFLAGLMQDIGILALDTMMPDEYAPVLASAADHEGLLAAEHAAFDCSHDVVGYWLLKRWELPNYLPLACLASHRQFTAGEDSATFNACVAASSYVADCFLKPLESGSAHMAAEEVYVRFGLDGTALAEIIDSVGAGMQEVAELFDVKPLRAHEMSTLLGEARALLVLCDLKREREFEEISHPEPASPATQSKPECAKFAMPKVTAMGTVSFQLKTGHTIASCEISSEALKVCFGARSMSAEHQLDAFHRSHKAIEEVARQQLELCGGFPVRLLVTDFECRVS